MKFRDSKTSKVYENICDARISYCNRIDMDCFNCEINNHGNKYDEFCDDFCKHNEKEAAKIMDYEVLEDEKDINCQASKVNIENPRLTLVPASLIKSVAYVRENDCKKCQDPENWRKTDKQKYVDAAYHYWLDYVSGKEKNKESGLPNLWHLACNIAFLIELDGE